MSLIFRKVSAWSCTLPTTCFPSGPHSAPEPLPYKVLSHDNCSAEDSRALEKLFYFLEADSYFWYKDFFFKPQNTLKNAIRSDSPALHLQAKICYFIRLTASGQRTYGAIDLRAMSG